MQTRKGVEGVSSRRQTDDPSGRGAGNGSFLATVPRVVRSPEEQPRLPFSSVHDNAKDLVLGGREGAQACYVYVDNLGVIAKMQQEADIVLEQWKNLFTENGLSLRKSALSQRSNPWALSWTVSPFCCRVSSKRFCCGEPWMRFFGKERSLDVPLKLSLVSSLSCFSMPDLRCVHCTRVVVSCARIITLRLASGQKLGPNWLRHLLIFSQSEWTRTWNTRVYYTDSSLSG